MVRPAGLVDCGRPHGGESGLFRRDDLLEEPAASHQRGLELLVVEDRAFDVWKRAGSGCTVGANHNQRLEGREAHARNDDGFVSAPEDPR